MREAKTAKIFLDESGSFLGRGEGCLIVRDKKGKVVKYPLFEDEIGEVQIRNGTSVSAAALQTLAFWNIDCVIMTQRGNPVAVVKSLEDDSHVETRIGQYEAIKNGKGVKIAKKIVLSRIEGQDRILRKYGLKPHDMMKTKEEIGRIESDKLSGVRRKLTTVEGLNTERYFRQIFQLLPKAILPDKRRTYKAYDGVNNTFNLAYTMLKWKVHKAIIAAKLEPFLGFVHSEQFGKPSLVCDLMELYRYLVDDFLIQYSKGLRKKDFLLRKEDFSSKRKGERQYLSKPLAVDMMKQLNSFFESKVEVPRVKNGRRQEIESLLNEEAMELARYLRDDKADWSPRLPSF